MVENNVAYKEFNEEDKHCVAFAEIKKEEGETWIKIPEVIAELDYLGINKGKVEMYYNEDGIVSFGGLTGKGIEEVKIKEEEEDFWLKTTNQMSTIKPLTGKHRNPVMLLSCGEIWIINNQDLWCKLSVGV